MLLRESTWPLAHALKRRPPRITHEKSAMKPSEECFQKHSVYIKWPACCSGPGPGCRRSGTQGSKLCGRQKTKDPDISATVVTSSDHRSTPNVGRLSPRMISAARTYSVAVIILDGNTMSQALVAPPDRIYEGCRPVPRACWTWIGPREGCPTW